MMMISPQAWGVHCTKKTNDMSFVPLVSDPSTYVKKRTLRQDDSVLLRHMDDVQLMIGFGHMKICLSLTDVVVLRNEGDTVNFFGS